MKHLLQQFLISLMALYATSSLFSGLSIKGGVGQYLYDAFLLMIGFMVVRPIINIVSLPFNALTFGLFSVVSTIIVIFLLSLFDRNFVIQPFTFQGLSIFQFTIPSFSFNIFLSYLVISATIQLVHKFLTNVFEL